MRKLAREAVIFMLLGLLFAFACSFFYMHHTQAKFIQSQREPLKLTCLHLTQPVRPGIDPPEGYDYFASATDEPLVTRAECNLIFGTNLESLPTPTSYAPDFYNRQAAALAEGTRIKNLKINNLELALTAFVGGLFGFVAGFCIWLFYRLVRFAIQG